MKELVAVYAIEESSSFTNSEIEQTVADMFNAAPREHTLAM